MAENNGLSGSPIIVVNLRSVFGGDRAHSVTGLVAWEAKSSRVIHHRDGASP